MTYQACIDYLYHQTPVFEHTGASAYKEGLETTIALDKHFNHPHQNFKTIHVAGTNGKGSCSHTLASILMHEGYRVGLYTSPHLIDFRERIKVNGKPISKSYVVNFVEQERNFFEPLRPSFFELTTAMAFHFFAEQHVDIAVIEVGLGGRLDCTNIISPILSIITNISFDHTQFLGSTLAQIASEKAGIIKPYTDVIIGESNDETAPVFCEKAKDCHASIVFADQADEIVSATAMDEGGFLYETKHFGTFRGELGGIYQQKNACTVLAACRNLMAKGVIQHRNSVTDGFGDVCQATGLMGRWQKIQERPLVVCDTGHNVGGWNYLKQQIARQSCRDKHIVFGMVDDKDIQTVLKMLPQDAHYYYTQADNHRAIPAEVVAEKAEALGLKGKTYKTVSAAYEDALANASADDFIFVGGSSYVVADFLTFLKKKGKID